MKVEEISDLSISEIEHIIELYPWFSFARKELFLKMASKGDDYRKEAIRKEVLYIYPDSKVFAKAYTLSMIAEKMAKEAEESKRIITIDDKDSDIVPSADVRSEVLPGSGEKQEILVIGGDYFSTQDFKDIQDKCGNPFESFNLSQDRLQDTVSQDDGMEFKDENFYTETLAKIYASQELYDRAIEVYDKLILLYPEKSVYFASLKENLKK